ncbi:Asp-tRNA(Asn)/Glu-tRNA(Gln) amidotransferase subunit GatC [Candidatus Woesebacteria bacterium]|nr:Asp-tRNA(Asn)/Glu-tRNA(Gln) amidotransferase subunit GatC [Candidatus Woesebacteria bacterium]
MSKHISATEVKHIGELANLPISDEQAVKIGAAFEETLLVVDNLKQIPTATVAPTYQVTGLENIMREDVVTPQRTFSQAEALQNAKRTYQGFFVVERVIEND